MRIISLLLSIAMIGLGIYGLALSGDASSRGYWIGALVVGVVWLIIDIIRIRSDRNNEE